MHLKMGGLRVAVAFGVVVLAAAVLAAAPGFSASTAQSCPKSPALPAAWASQIDNPYLPLAPGTTWTYKGKLEGVPSTDVFTVTSQKKVILGVATTVIHDQVFQRGDLVEDTFDWFAQEASGTVWYFGEDTKELDHGTVVTTEGSWEAGVNNARAGIFMPATPAVGQVFMQEDAKNVAEDCTKIADLHASVRTPNVTTSDALKTQEFSLLEPGVLDNKYYVRGVGLVAE